MPLDATLRDRLRGEYKLIIVANSGPAAATATNAGAGGGVQPVYTGLAIQTGATYICAKAVGEPECETVIVNFPPAEYAKSYDVVQTVLYHLQLGLYDRAITPVFGEHMDDAWENGYEPCNERYAQAVIKVATASMRAGRTPIVDFQDFHVYRTPQRVRRALPNALLTFFAHIPWPAPDSWSMLPSHHFKQIVEGLLACDALGFQDVDSTRNFLRCAELVLGRRAVHDDGTIDYTDPGLGGRFRRVAVRTRPISIDPEEIEARANDPRTRLERTKIQAYEGRHDWRWLFPARRDPAKNLLRGLDACTIALRKRPKFQGRGSAHFFLNVARPHIAEWQRYAALVERRMEEFEAEFATPQWPHPLRVELRENKFRLAALIKESTVVVLPSVADGMVLIAKEVPFQNRDASMVLSRRIGASRELNPWAFLVNPFDPQEMADMICRAELTPPGERRERMDSMRSHIRGHNVSGWLQARYGVDLGIGPGTRPRSPLTPVFLAATPQTPGGQIGRGRGL
jgi:trehalose 6-phosphate synthase